VRIVRPPGVFGPISDTWQLADALRRETLWPGARVLDLGTGSGTLALTAAKRGAAVTAVDVSRRALLTVRLNARLNGVRVRAVRGSLFAPVVHERFDCIVSNPPYVPSTQSSLPASGASRAWEAGPDGRVLLDRIIEQAPEHLRGDGVLLLTHSTLIGEQETLERLRDAGLRAAVVDRRRGPLGPLMRERVRQGVLPATVTEEEVLVVRARRKAAKSTISVPAALMSGREGA
jgi:release factor glutamine methyltransferase